MNRLTGISKLALVHGAISAMVASFGQQLAAQTAVASDMKPKRSTSNATNAGSSGRSLHSSGTYVSAEGRQRIKDRQIAYRSRSHAISKLSNTKKRALGIKL